MDKFIEKLMSQDWKWEDRILLEEGTFCLSGQQFFNRIRHAGARLLEMGLKEGERVLLLLPVGIRLYVSLYALWSIGCTAVIFDSKMEPVTMRQCIERGRIRRIISLEKRKSQLNILTGNGMELIAWENLSSDTEEAGK